MKEYCLVPRNLAEKMREGSTGVGEGYSKPQNALEQNTGGGVGKSESELRPGRRKKKHRKSEGIQRLIRELMNRKEGNRTKTRRIRKAKSKPTLLPRPKIITRGNPSLDHIIHASFTQGTFKYALGLLRFFENKDNIEWDELGELRKPIGGVNLIVLLRKMIADRSAIPEEDFLSYKLFLDAANVPYSLIKNNTARKQLEMNSATLPKGKGWITYA